MALKSIIARLGTEAFPRIRIGVGEKPRPDYDLADWVLGRFSEEEAKAVAGRRPTSRQPPASSWTASWGRRKTATTADRPQTVR